MKKQRLLSMPRSHSNWVKNTAITTALLALSLPSAFAQPKAKCQNNVTVNVWCTPIPVPVAGLDNGSTGGTVSLTYKGAPVTGPNLYFDCSNAGSNPVTLTVTSASGATSTCIVNVKVNCHAPKCNINAFYNASITGSGPAAGVPGNGTAGNPYIAYIGYPGLKSTLTLVGAGGGTNYFWTVTPITTGGSAGLVCTPTTITGSGSTSSSSTSVPSATVTGCNSVDFTPSVEGLYNVSLTTISEDDPEQDNDKKCRTTCSVTICVRDITDDLADSNPEGGDLSTKCDGKDKVMICHWDNKAFKYKSMKICAADVAKHLKHGDYIGKCDKPCGIKKDFDPATSRMAGQTVNNGDMHLTIAPNPSRTDFHITLSSTLAATVDIIVYDLSGRIIEKQLNQSTAGEITVGKNLAPGMYVVSVKQGAQTQMIKVVKE
jgi:hypothetical protein